LSNILSGADLGEAQAIGLGSLGTIQGGSAFHARFADGQEIVRRPAVRNDGPTLDPVEQARADAFAEGFDAGMRIAGENQTADEDTRGRLATALEQIAPASNGALSALLSAAVLRLVTQIVGEVEIDADLLARRVEAVAAFIEEEQGRTGLRVNPDDLALLEDHEFGLPLTPDASVSRGGVRLDTADGWIEDGLDVQLSRLKAMLDNMEGRE
jgi:flagellar assembly protein FliH